MLMSMEEDHVEVVKFHEPYIYKPKWDLSENMYAMELSNKCKLNNGFNMTKISHKSNKYCSDYHNINLH